MTKVDEERRIVANRVTKCEKTADEISELADKLLKKMENLHLETMATRERARAARQRAEVQNTAVREARQKRRTKQIGDSSGSENGGGRRGI